MTTSKQVWENDGVTFVNNKAASTNNVADYSNPVRLYANSEIVVSCSFAFNKIQFSASSSSYATALKNSIKSDSNYSVSASGSTVTVSFSVPAESFTVKKLSAQVRLSNIKVTEVEVVTENEELTNIKTSLNEVAANMSLAYKYNTIKETISGETVVTQNFSLNNYENGQAVSKVVDQLTTITFALGSNSNSNAPKYYTTGSAIRCYAGNVFTVESVMTIKKIVITFGTGEEYTNAIVPNVGEITGNTWVGEASSVTFSISGSTGHRRIKSIEITMDGTSTISSYSDVEFRIKCGVLNSIADIENVEEYGVAVSANSDPIHYSVSNEKKDFYFSDNTHNFALISLGDALNNKSRLETKFTVRAYVIYEGEYYYSESIKTASVIDLVKTYYGMDAYKEQITPLVEVLTSMGYTFE